MRGKLNVVLISRKWRSSRTFSLIAWLALKQQKKGCGSLSQAWFCHKEEKKQMFFPRIAGEGANSCDKYDRSSKFFYWNVWFWTVFKNDSRCWTYILHHLHAAGGLINIAKEKKSMQNVWTFDFQESRTLFSRIQNSILKNPKQKDGAILSGCDFAMNKRIHWRSSRLLCGYLLKIGSKTCIKPKVLHINRPSARCCTKKLTQLFFSTWLSICSFNIIDVDQR